MEYKEGAEYIEPVSNRDGSKSLLGGYWSSESTDFNLLRGLLVRFFLKRAGDDDTGTNKWAPVQIFLGVAEVL